jgi:hypothetical protein
MRSDEWSDSWTMMKKCGPVPRTNRVQFHVGFLTRPTFLYQSKLQMLGFNSPFPLIRRGFRALEKLNQEARRISSSVPEGVPADLCMGAGALLRSLLWSVLVVSSKNGTVDVWPKLFEDVEDAVNRYLRQPFLSSFGPRAFLCRVVKIGDTCSCPIADNFREIETPAV